MKRKSSTSPSFKGLCSFLIILQFLKESNQNCPDNTFIDLQNNCKPCNTLLPRCETCLKDLTCTSCSSGYILQTSINHEGREFQFCDKPYWLTKWWGLIIIGGGSILFGILFSVIICIFARFCMANKKKNRVSNRPGRVGIFRKRKARKFSMKVEKSRYDFSENIESQVNLREEIENNRLEFKKFKDEVIRTRQSNKEFDWNKFRLSLEMSNNRDISSKVSDELRFGNERSTENPHKLPPISSKTLGNSRFSFNGGDPHNLNCPIQRGVDNQSPSYSINTPNVVPQKRLSHFYQGDPVLNQADNLKILNQSPVANRSLAENVNQNVSIKSKANI